MKLKIYRYIINFFSLFVNEFFDFGKIFTINYIYMRGFMAKKTME